MKKLLTASVVMLLTACATTPTISAKAKIVPAERVLAYAQQNENYARVEITRDSGMFGSGCYLGVMYRQTLLARFDVGEKAVFYLPEGSWNFAVVADPYGRALCAFTQNPAVEKQEIRKNRENLFRISSGAYRRPRLLPF